MKANASILILWAAILGLNAGLAWLEPVLVAQDQNTQYSVSAVRGLQDETVVVWLQRPNGNGRYQIRMQTVLPDGSLKFRPEGVPLSSDCLTSNNPPHPSVVVTPGGEIFVGWYDHVAGDYKVQLFSSQAQPLWGTEPLSLSGIGSWARAMYIDGAFIIAYAKDVGSYLHRIWGQKIVDGATVWPAEGLQLVTPHPQHYNSGTEYFSSLGPYLAWNLDPIQQLFVLKLDQDGNPAPGFNAWGNQVSQRAAPYHLGSFSFRLFGENLHCRWHEAYEVHPSFEYWDLRHVQQVVGPNGELLIPTPGVVDEDEGDPFFLTTYGYDIGVGENYWLTGNGSVYGYRLRRFSPSGNLLADTLTPVVPVPHYPGSDLYRLDALSDGNALLLTSQFLSLKYDLIDAQGQWVTPANNTVFNQYVSESRLACARSGDTLLLAAAVAQDSEYSDSLQLQKIVPAGSSAANPGSVTPLFELSVTRPNPFRNKTEFSCQTGKAGNLQIAVYNLRGQKVRVIFAGSITAGKIDFAWDGRDDHGQAVSSGVYLLRASFEGKVSQSKVLKLW